RGIGRAIALTLARAGYQVVAAATSIESNEEFGAELRAAGGQPLMVNLDVSSPESVKAAFTRAAAEKSRIDILVNNAGVTRDGLAVRMKPADWEQVLRINLQGAFLCTQQV